jgi:hypothetical protein
MNHVDYIRIDKEEKMTTLLSKAFKKASGLPESLQDELARKLLEELEWERKWETSIKNSSDKIDRLAEQALHEYKAGKTSEIGIDEL